MRSRRNAFTLIELVVVVIVLGVLMAVAIPSFFGASNSAKDSAAKQYLTTSYKELKAAIAANDGTAPAQPSLLGFLASAEPQLSYSSAAAASASGDAKQVNVEQTASGYKLGSRSASGALCTLTADRSSGYTPQLACDAATATTAPPPAPTSYLSFDGVSGNAQVAQNAALRPSAASTLFGFGVWLRLRQFPAAGQFATLASTYCNTGSGCSGEQGWELIMDSGGNLRLFFGLGGSTVLTTNWSNASSQLCWGETGTTAATPKALTVDGRWHYISGTWTMNDRVRLSLDGKIMDCTGITSGAPAYSSEPVELAGRPSSSTAYAGVDITSFRIINQGGTAISGVTVGGSAAPPDMATGPGVVSVWNFNSSLVDDTGASGAFALVGGASAN